MSELIEIADVVLEEDVVLEDVEEDVEEVNISCVLNETEDNQFYDEAYILSQFDFTTNNKEREEENLADELNNIEDVEDIDESMELDQLSLFDMSASQLSTICEYYHLNKVNNKKQNKIEQILLFESNKENKDRVFARYKIWNVMNLLKKDKIMKKYIIWT